MGLQLNARHAKVILKPFRDFTKRSKVPPFVAVSRCQWGELVYVPPLLNNFNIDHFLEMILGWKKPNALLLGQNCGHSNLQLETAMTAVWSPTLKGALSAYFEAS